jgi:hypothetical protein
MPSNQENTEPNKTSWTWWLSAAAVVGIAVVSMHASVDTSRSLSLRSAIPESNIGHQAHNYARLYSDVQLQPRQEAGCSTEPCNQLNGLCNHNLNTPKYVRSLLGKTYWPDELRLW